MHQGRQPLGARSTAASGRAAAAAAPRCRCGSSPRLRGPGRRSAPAARRALAARLVVAVSVPERQTVTERTPAPLPQEVEVKVVGIGSRGAQAISKLVQHKQAERAELWCLDVDRAALEAAPTGNTLLLPKDDPAATEGRLSPADLQRIVGRAASDAGGRGNISAGTDGALTFVLAPAAAAPGGAATVLQVVAALRAAGHFTVAAVTQPFGFEGAAKREQASELIAALKETAHVVAVMEQDVLMQAFGDAQMTVAEATSIADTALEHVVLCMLSAVQAEEVLKSSRGALMWHGRDLRHFKRILPPPLQQLLTRPGTAVLGRGLASVPAEAAHQMGAAQALMHLASDAVRAAAESPFLDGALDAASGVLCSISLPPADQPFATGSGGAAPLAELQTPDGERRAVRLAAQAAAGALGSMSGASCHDFVLCVDKIAAPPAGGDTDGGSLRVEATLVVMRGAGEPPGGVRRGSASRRPLLQQPQPFVVGPAVPPPPRQPQRLPSSAWGMLSAVAGGAAASAPKAAPSAAQRQGGQQQQQARAPPKDAPNFFGSGRPRPQQAQPARQQQQQPTAPPAAAPGQQPAAPRPRVQVQRPGQPSATPEPRAAAAAGPAAPEAAPEAAVAGELHLRASVGDYMSKSQLTAQSLDMSPAAARWRQEHRGDDFEQRKLIVWEVEEEEEEAWQEEEEEGLGLAALLPPGMRKERKKPDLKARMSSILIQDREDAWVADNNLDE